MSLRRTVHKTCNLCEACCGLRIEVEATDRGDHVVAIEGDPDDPLSRGHLCPKAFALEEVQRDPDRLRWPARRSGDRWQRVSWQEALDEVATRLAEIQRRDGDDAVATYLGNPGAHNFGSVMTVTLINRALATRNKYTASSLDQNPRHAASELLYGSVFSIPVPDVDRCDYLLVLGANPLASSGSLMTAPDFRRRVRDLQSRGGRLVVVDPRRSETAAIADEHVFVRPGSDAHLLAAMANVLLDEDRVRSCEAWKFVRGLETLSAALAPFSPEAVAPQVGLSADAIRALARAFSSADRAACYGRTGTCLHPYATLASWLIDILNLLTGNLDRVGGSMFATPPVDLVALVERASGAPREPWRTRVRGAPSFNDEQPSACLAEEILTPGEGQVRGLLTIAGNPVLSAPNGRKLDSALAGLEFFAAVDLYVNETTRHADLILPPTWSLEHANHEVVFHQFAVRNVAKFSPVVLAPPEGALREWEILSELGLRIAERKSGNPAVAFALRQARRAKGAFHPMRLLDALIRLGPHGDGFRPWRHGLRLQDLRDHPSGIDLGPLEPSLHRVLRTPDRRIDLAPPAMLGELARLATDLAPPGDGAALSLIGRRDLRTNNSWLHNAPSLTRGRDRCTLLMHPHDAGARGLHDGEPVRITSRVGAVVARLEVSDEVMAGVVSLPHGWGHDREGAHLSVASATPGVSVNDLTDDEAIEPIVGNAILNGVAVEVERAGR